MSKIINIRPRTFKIAGRVYHVAADGTLSSETRGRYSPEAIARRDEIVAGSKSVPVKAVKEKAPKAEKTPKAPKAEKGNIVVLNGAKFRLVPVTASATVAAPAKAKAPKGKVTVVSPKAKAPKAPKAGTETIATFKVKDREYMVTADGTLKSTVRGRYAPEALTKRDEIMAGRTSPVVPPAGDAAPAGEGAQAPAAPQA